MFKYPRTFEELKTVEDIPPIEEIARVLSNICRWGGQTYLFYSVARHCVEVSRQLEKHGASLHTQLQGLLHDASEVFIGDIITPVKKLCPEIRELEKNVLLPLIYTKFGVQITPTSTLFVETMDSSCGQDEYHKYIVCDREHLIHYSSLDITLFLDRFYDLIGEIAGVEGEQRQAYIG